MRERFGFLFLFCHIGICICYLKNICWKKASTFFGKEINKYIIINKKALKIGLCHVKGGVHRGKIIIYLSRFKNGLVWYECPLWSITGDHGGHSHLTPYTFFSWGRGNDLPHWKSICGPLSYNYFTTKLSGVFESKFLYPVVHIYILFSVCLPVCRTDRVKVLVCAIILDQ